MLGYRHVFHAGNHGDVLKHVVLVQLLRHLARKDKPFWVIDTHAGAGVYALDSPPAQRLAEHDSGIGRLWGRTGLAPALADYVDLVRAMNPDGRLRTYPGSPWLALQCLRPQDRLRLFERHPTDGAWLKETFRQHARQVTVTAGDGFEGMKALLPPPPRRGLVLIDPSYELREDYARVVQALKEGLRRFATGTYAIWYPLLARLEARRLPQRLKAAAGLRGFVHVTLSVRAPNPDGLGLYGSGLFVVNPPWTLPATLQAALPQLVSILGQDSHADFLLEAREAVGA